MTEFEIVEIPAQQAAVVRGELPVAELPSLFDRAFHLVMEAVQSQGLAIAGPPFGYYPRMPTDTVEVAAGFPVAGAFVPTDQVSALELPGGRVVRGVHVGPYDTLEQTYGALLAWASSQGVELGVGMWESYLSDPAAEPDPSTWRTEISWPLRD